MFALNQFPLQFAEDALAPYMSAQTLNCHHGKHLATYIKNLNDLSAGTRYADMPLMEIITESARDDAAKKIFNNAAQVFNHDFFFKCLTPNGGGEIPREIIDVFGGVDNLSQNLRPRPPACLAVAGPGLCVTAMRYGL